MKNLYFTDKPLPLAVAILANEYKCYGYMPNFTNKKNALKFKKKMKDLGYNIDFVNAEIRIKK